MAIIEIDGKTVEAENGEMIIEVADRENIYIPRFCYHKELSVAANCRMCLVEVENGRKPVPACATPITQGMKVFTKSEEALRSQKAVMEFLLINHPLDCPVCDQGGECELQDLSMGFGYAESEYNDNKRSVTDDNLGSLIATEMTRCIHCTRCVRFGEEVAGLRELGATGRGEDTHIGTYVKHSMVSEVSGNIIDLCPVGALTSKPSRFTARPWELTQHEGIAPHDCLGSNIHLHTRRADLIRVVPKENYAINETWLSDRDRFSYLSLASDKRASQPKIKVDGQWETVDWSRALQFTAEGLARIIKTYGSDELAAFASPSSTLEELYLLQKMMRELGVRNLDHRIRQTDFSDSEYFPAKIGETLKYSELDKQDNILILGCNIQREVPLASLRVRKAFRNGSKIFSINSIDYDFPFTKQDKVIASPTDFPLILAKLILALSKDPNSLPEEVQRLIIGLQADKSIKSIANALKQPKSVIVIGALVENHPEAALLRTLLHVILDLSGAKILSFTAGANSAGANLVGMLPHKSALGKDISPKGLDCQAAINAKLKSYFLLALEPEYDFANPYLANQTLLGAEFVISLTAFHQESMENYADVILPIAPFAETSGTFINIDNEWQSFKGSSAPREGAKPAWKIIRVLANLLHCKNFEYDSTKDILEEISGLQGQRVETKYQASFPEALPVYMHSLTRVGEWPLYRTDAIVRNSLALQKSAAADVANLRIHPKTANRLKLAELATVSQGDIEITLPVECDERVAEDVICVANAMSETVDLGLPFAPINIKP